MAPKKQTEPDEVMIVNDSPGEECRIAILQNGHLEELFTERTATATDVGNIYKGRVTNVEPAIQAAFVDYGQSANGFLHISDLHPKYFPGAERTERVGKKIPRRERPPIQAALRRGQEILVQVLKEGIGTKGPTLTGYLSIPGRLLVLMPDMDKVGVSRKVEDEAQRREMREILDSLELPDGFGFILRTAGYGRTKTELKRDAAYLMRLWKVMEKRIKGVGAPCELYTESDLLLRTVRDVLRPSIKTIVVDSESAFDRISMFLRVVTPRSAPKVIHYRRPTPIFHAFDVERQIELIHSREVPLPSGGRLVIDQTEALVAIDVNSGRSRSARDSETNAYETNLEAADEICRQLRLRDLGGLIVNDLIDMRSVKHRRLIEERFEALLKKDRAKATALAISEFGILEMTRQRMRPSIRKSHFMDCPHCNGHGEIRVPEYVASDAVRHVGFLLQHERVRRVEIACSPRVASVLLSGKRRELVRMEDLSRKKIDVRVSEAIAVDRVDYYAYDERAADIDIARLPPLAGPTMEQLEAEQESPAPEPLEEIAVEGGARRRRRPGPADAASIALAGDFADDFEFDEDEDDESLETGEGEPNQGDDATQAAGTVQTEQRGEGGKKRRRRRRKRGGGGGAAGTVQSLRGSAAFDGSPDSSETVAEAAASGAEGTVHGQPIGGEESGEGRPRRGRKRRRRRGGDRAATGAAPQATMSGDTDQAPQAGSGEPPAGFGSERAENPADLPPRGGEQQPIPADGSDAKPSAAKRKRSRRRKGKRIGDAASPASASDDSGSDSSVPGIAFDQPPINAVSDASEGGGDATGSGVDGKPGRKRRRRRRGRKGGAGSASSIQAPNDGQSSDSPGPAMNHPTPDSASAKPSDGTAPIPAKKPRRALYRAARVAVSPIARATLGSADE